MGWSFKYNWDQIKGAIGSHPCTEQALHTVKKRELKEYNSGNWAPLQCTHKITTKSIVRMRHCMRARSLIKRLAFAMQHEVLLTP